MMARPRSGGNHGSGAAAFPLTRFPAPPILPGMFTFGYLGGGQHLDPLAFLLVALLAEAYLGNVAALLGRGRHPVELIGNLIGFLDGKLNREDRSEMDRAVRGFLVVLVVGGLALLAGLGVAWLSLNHAFGPIVEILLLIMLLAQRSLYEHVAAVGAGLSKGGLEAGREAVSHIVGRDPRQLDEHGVARAGIESLAENFNDGVVAPVFWYVLFGFPGLLVYKAVNTMDSMIGHMTPKYRAFGMAAARMDDILNLIPARLAGLFVALAAAFAPTAHPGRAVKVMLRDASKHRSPNAGWPEGAMAGALDLALAGPRRYAKNVVSDPWIGDGTARAGANDISRALYVYWVACLINGGWVAAIALLRFGMA